MVQHKHNDNRRRHVLAVAAGALAVGAVTVAPAAGQSERPKRPEVSKAKAVSPNATINLVNALVKQGVLSEEQAQVLIQQAQDEAFIASQSAKDATTKAEEASKAAATAVNAAAPPGTKRVTYVPEVVKKQLRDELRREVMDKARAEHWASPGLYPEWASRIRFYGDVRARFEGQFYPTGNFNPYDFNAINNGSPYNAIELNPFSAPTINGTEDRNRTRLRARLGLEADLFDGFTAGFRMATGDSSSPVSTNQTLGASGSNFSKYSLWLDRAWLKYQPVEEITALIGRFDNPFWTASDMVWNRDLGFDGAALKLKTDLAPEFQAFANGGAFPIFNTALNAGFNDYFGTKVESNDKWMQGGQVGFSARFGSDWSFTVAGAFYNFSNVQGKASSPCDNMTSSSIICDTDSHRPLFAQKGNTYFQLRTFDPVTYGNLLAGGATQDSIPNYQYYGLASEFRPVVLSARAAWTHFNPVHVVLEGEFVKNTGFDRAAIQALAPDNNVTPRVEDANGNVLQEGGIFQGGDMGYFARLTVGHPETRKLWDWNVHVGYKYVESDAVIDAFTDSDFGLGGTNLKGYFIGGNLGLSNNVWASVRWLSANSIAGEPYSVDIIQLDLNAKF